MPAVVRNLHSLGRVAQQRGHAVPPIPATLPSHQDCRLCVWLSPADCLRELDHSLATNKPLVLVHEDDITKGGAPLEVLQLEYDKHQQQKRPASRQASDVQTRSRPVIEPTRDKLYNHEPGQSESRPETRDTSMNQVSREADQEQSEHEQGQP